MNSNHKLFETTYNKDFTLNDRNKGVATVSSLHNLKMNSLLSFPLSQNLKQKPNANKNVTE